MTGADLRSRLAEAAVSIVLRGLDDGGRALNLKQKHEHLTKAAELDPDAILSAIRRMEAQIELLSAYVGDQS
jgi:hypothetical protein